MKGLIFIIILISLPLLSQVKVEVLDTTRFSSFGHTNLDAIDNTCILIGDISSTYCPFIRVTHDLKNWNNTYVACDTDTFDLERRSQMFRVSALNNTIIAVGDSLKLYISHNRGNSWTVSQIRTNEDNATALITNNLNRNFALFTEYLSAKIYDDEKNLWSDVLLPDSLKPLSIYGGGIYNKNFYVLGVRYNKIINLPAISQSIIVHHNGEFNTTYFQDRRLNEFYVLKNKIIALGRQYRLNDSSLLKSFLYISDDFGKTWYEHPVTKQFNRYAYFGRIKFFDEKVGIFAGTQTEWYLTTDGGETWVKQEDYVKSDKLDYSHAYFAFLNKNKIICTAGNFPIVFTLEFPVSNIETELEVNEEVKASKHIELFDILGRNINTFQSYDELKEERNNFQYPYLIKWRDSGGVFHFEKMK